ncbi:MAG: hypothetical protein IPL53_20065 [Ignavibacteria bacterium]|nr:hypothetical protein [Ignavibacteria bacterium]
MKTKIFKSAVLLLISISVLSFDVPNGWKKTGSHPDEYEMGIDKGTGHNGKNSASIKSKSENIEGFGTLLQSSSPEKYSGKKIKMTGYVKSKDVTGWAGLWLRVDQPDSQEPLSFDNMQDRAIRNTTDWTKYEIILDVPSNASNIVYGALLAGTGQIWFDDITFEVLPSESDNPGDNRFG